MVGSCQFHRQDMEKQPQQWLSGVAERDAMHFIVAGALEKTFFTLEVSIVVRALPRPNFSPALQEGSCRCTAIVPWGYSSYAQWKKWTGSAPSHLRLSEFIMSANTQKPNTPVFLMRRNKSPFALRVEIWCCARSHLKFKTKGRATIARCAWHKPRHVWERGLLTEKMFP